MYGIMRNYKLSGSFDDVVQKARDGLVPLLRRIEGFRAYRIVDFGDGRLASFGLFDDKNAADESTRKAREWVESDPSIKTMLPEPPTVLAGPVGLNITA